MLAHLRRLRRLEGDSIVATRTLERLTIAVKSAHWSSTTWVQIPALPWGEWKYHSEPQSPSVRLERS